MDDGNGAGTSDVSDLSSNALIRVCSWVAEHIVERGVELVREALGMEPFQDGIEDPNAEVLGECTVQIEEGGHAVGNEGEHEANEEGCVGLDVRTDGVDLGVALTHHDKGRGGGLDTFGKGTIKEVTEADDGGQVNFEELSEVIEHEGDEDG